MTEENKYQILLTVVLGLIFMFLTVILMLISGCSVEASGNKRDISVYYRRYVDYDTCVEYYGEFRYGATPAYNQDGTLKLDNDCLAKREK